jgi:predicted RND superfamily exporter protein
MVVAALVIVAVSTTGIARLQFSNDVMGWLPPDNPLRQSTDLIDRELKGSMTLEVVVDTGVENGIKDPALLKSLDDLSAQVQQVRRGDYLFVGRTISIADVVKEIHQALNENRGEYYAIPDDARLVSQELLLFENTGSDDLEDVVDTQFRRARFTLKVPYTDPIRYDGFIGEVEDLFRNALPPGTEIATTGFMGMMGQTILRVIRGLARSYALALIIITPLMMVLLGSLRTGLASMLPNLSPIALTLGLMGWMGVHIDMFTMMIGSIAIGLVVDDTIHFMHGFRRYYARSGGANGGDARLAIRQTLESTGQALLFTSIVLTLGFSVFVLSEMQNLFYFGAFTAFAIAAAFMLDILVSPALMVLVARSDARRAAKSD